MQTTEEKFHDIITQNLEQQGMRSVKTSITGSSEITKASNIEILIEKQNFSPASLGDCKTLTKKLKKALDNEFAENIYSITVSSPGVERPLITLEDYIRFKGRIAKIFLLQDLILEDNKTKKVFTAKILGVDKSDVSLEIDGTYNVAIDFSKIKKAHLVMTEEMFRSYLNKKQK